MNFCPPACPAKQGLRGKAFPQFCVSRISNQNVDGAISSATSTVYETALALDALIASNSDVSTVAQPAIDYSFNKSTT